MVIVLGILSLTVTSAATPLTTVAVSSNPIPGGDPPSSSNKPTAVHGIDKTLMISFMFSYMCQKLFRIAVYIRSSCHRTRKGEQPR